MKIKAQQKRIDSLERDNDAMLLELAELRTKQTLAQTAAVTALEEALAAETQVRKGKNKKSFVFTVDSIAASSSCLFF